MSLALLLAAPFTGFGAVELFTGTMQVVSASGKACDRAYGQHTVELLLSRDDASSEISGYFEGDEVTTGHFAGSDPARLAVRYPYHDEFRAAGHVIGIAFDKSGLRAELRDRHIDANVDDCNFDLAKLSLSRVKDGRKAEVRFKRIKALYDAQLMRSEAYALTRQGQHNLSLQLYEKAISKVDSVGEYNPKFMVPFITGLANNYMRAQRYSDFDRLYEERISGITDEAVRKLFKGYRIRTLLSDGKSALGREDYTTALDKFNEAYRLNPLNRDAIAAVMAAKVSAGKHESAIEFLEKAIKPIDNNIDRMDVRRAIAVVQLNKAKRDDKQGKGLEAEAALRKAMALDPGNVLYLVALARQRHKSGSLPEAEDILRRGLERFEDGPSRQEILSALDRLRLTESILKRLRKMGG